jgi:hypothetical protein
VTVPDSVPVISWAEMPQAETKRQIRQTTRIFMRTKTP